MRYINSRKQHQTQWSVKNKGETYREVERERRKRRKLGITTDLNKAQAAKVINHLIYHLPADFPQSRDDSHRCVFAFSWSASSHDDCTGRNCHLYWLSITDLISELTYVCLSVSPTPAACQWLMGHRLQTIPLSPHLCTRQIYSQQIQTGNFKHWSHRRGCVSFDWRYLKWWYVWCCCVCDLSVCVLVCLWPACSSLGSKCMPYSSVICWVPPLIVHLSLYSCQWIKHQKALGYQKQHTEKCQHAQLHTRAHTHTRYEWAH